MNTIDLVILSCNSSGTLEASIASAREAASQFGERTGILVLDDGSDDGSASIAEGMGCKIIRSPAKRGFPVAANEALQTAESPLALLLNADVLLEEGALAPLVSCLQEDRVLAASPVAWLRDRETLDMGRCVGGMTRGWFRFKQIPWKDGVAPTLYASGGYMALRREPFFSLGGFDALFSPGYWEDLDLCYRGWKQGWRILFQPASSVLHWKGQSFNALYKRDRLERLKSRNRFLFMWMNLSSYSLARHLSWLPLKLVKSVVTGKTGFLQAFLEASARLPDVLRRRREDRPHWRRKDHEILDAIRDGGEPCAS